MSQVIHLSVVIPAYNEAKNLATNLPRIKDALSAIIPPKYKWEIVVCDNNSTDSTAKVAQQAGAKVIFEAINQISRARNTGAQIASGKWLLFLDADSYPTPDLIDDLQQLIESGNFIGCGTTVQVEGGTLFNKLRMERLNPIFRALNTAGGVCLLCEHQAFQEIDGFSENLYAYEEFDFIQRLKRCGHKQGKQFTVLHKHPIITSGRKGDFSLPAIIKMIGSNLIAICLYLLRAILPNSWHRALAHRGLGFWYNERKD